jgi:flagellar biosynthetic protein FlhB
MADGEDKTLPATPKRRLERRRQGSVARSSEFSPATTLLALTVVLHLALPGVAGHSLIDNVQYAFAFNPHAEDFGYATVYKWQSTGLLWASQLVLPVVLTALFLGLAANIYQVGLSFFPEILTPHFDHLNPVQGFQRLFSKQGVVNLVKGIAKMLIVGGICYSTLKNAVLSGTLLNAINMPLQTTMDVMGGLLWTLGLRVSLTLFLLAIADYIYQKYAFEKAIRMSVSEVKQESRDAEGDPKIKAKIRKLQREIAKRKMMKDVPKADVVITNPTHYAVALQYDPTDQAPRVLAKGHDEVAQVIKEIAREHQIPTVENKPLAQTLFKTVEIGDEIPPHLYEAVAQVLAFVYRTYSRYRRKRLTGTVRASA